MDKYSKVLHRLLSNLDAEPTSEDDRAARKASLISAFPIPREAREVAAFAEFCVASHQAASAISGDAGRTLAGAWKRKADLSIAMLHLSGEDSAISAAVLLSACLSSE